MLLINRVGTICLAWVLLQATAWAIVVPTINTSTTQNNFTPSNADLVNFNAATLQAATPIGFTVDSGLAFSNINNGVSASTSQGTFEFEGNGGGTWTAEFTLNTTLNPLGYSISRIDSIASWQDGRAAQRATVTYNTVSDPTFQPLGTYTTALMGSGGSSRIRLEDDINVLAAGVKTIRIDYTAATGTTLMPIIQEVDVFGTPTLAAVPEPAGLVIWSILGAVGVVFGWRKIRARTSSSPCK